MISDGDKSLISNTPCPKPTTLTAVSNSAELSKLGALAYVKFKFTSRNDTFKLHSVGLLDSGANVSLVQIDLLPKRVANNLSPLDTSVSGVGGNINILGTITGKVEIGDAEFSNTTFYVVDKTVQNCKVIIGTNVLMHPNLATLTVNTAAKKVIFDFSCRDSAKTISKGCDFLNTNPINPDGETVGSSQIPARESGNDDEKAPTNTLREMTLREKLEYLKKEKDIDLYHSDEGTITKFADMLISNLSIFGSEGELGCFPTPVRIETKGDPINVRPHAIAQKFQPVVQGEVDKMLKAGVIEECKDPKGWNSPILCVSKKDGSVRVCANFKNTINKRLCRPDPFPAPAIEEIFNGIEDGNRFFSSIDLQSGYWQLTIREEDRHKTSFTWNDVTYQFVRLPFGYTASGACFSRAVATALTSVGFDRKKVIVYIDDIAILGNNIENFVENHEIVFKALKNFNLRLKARKCHFLREEIPFLGCLLSAQGRRPIPEYVEGIMNIRAPTNTKELKQTQGRLTWINAFIGSRMGEVIKSTSFSALMDPILNVSRNAPFKWTQEADKALNKIKERMTKPPFISFSDPSLPYVLITDASDVALGGMLCQKKGDQYRVIGTCSKLFTPTERRWSTTEREAYSILHCIKKFSYFLTRNHFTVFTDHKSLVYMDRRTFNNAKVSRWQDELSRYSFHVQYVEGEENVWADWLSRPYTKNRFANSSEEPEDFSPAGKYIGIEGTKMKIYVPSWVLDKFDPDMKKLRFKNDQNDVICSVAFNTSRNDHEPDDIKTLTGHGYNYDTVFQPDHIETGTLPIALAAFITERKVPDNPEMFQYLDLAEKQRLDQCFAKIIARLESPEPLKDGQLLKYIDSRDHRFSWFKHFANRLFVDPMTRLLMVREGNRHAIVIPDSLRRQMLHSAHDVMGHCGKERVLEHLRSMTWPGKYKDASDYVKSCEHCPRVKGNWGKRPFKPGHNLRGTTANEVLYLDYIFLKKTKNGFQYALTIIDSFTRYVSVYPSRNNRACDTARFLYDYVTRFGRIPSVISTDRGSHFVGQVMQDFCQHMGIKHNIHCAYRPQSTGILERAHRTLKTSLKIVAEEMGKSWPEVLNHVVASMNAVQNKATRCSPFYAMFGRQYCLDLPRLPEQDKRYFDPLTHGMDLDASMVKIHRLVDLCAKNADFVLDNSLRESKPENFGQGDKVLIYRPLSTSADAKVDWKPGYSVLKSNEFAAKLKNDENGLTDWVHRTHIRKLHPRPSHLEDDSEDEMEFEPVNTLREMSAKNDPDESSSRGVNGSNTDNIKVEDTSSSSLDASRNDTSRNDSVNSDSRKRVCETEKEMADILQNSLRNRQIKRRRTISERNKKKNISEIAVRKSGRERKAPDRLQVDSTKGKSYIKKSST